MFSELTLLLECDELEDTTIEEISGDLGGDLYILLVANDSAGSTISKLEISDLLSHNSSLTIGNFPVTIDWGGTSNYTLLI